MIIARTDARAVTGLDDAIARATLREAGADVALRRGAPDPGRDPVGRAGGQGAAARQHGRRGQDAAVKISELERLGFKIVIFPAVCMAAAVPAMERALIQLRERETD